MNPADRVYQDTHEWAKLDGNVVTVGITQHAVEELTDLVYIELPEPGKEVKRGEAFGEIESVKAVSDLVSPVHGTVVEVHADLEDDLDLVGNDPYGEGWMVKVQVADASAIEGLMSAAEYEDSLKAE